MRPRYPYQPVEHTGVAGMPDADEAQALKNAQMRSRHNSPKGRQDWGMLIILGIMMALCTAMIFFYLHTVKNAPPHANSRWTPEGNAPRIPKVEERFNGDENFHECISKIKFPYNAILNGCEGYYRNSETPEETDASKELPFPVKHPLPWCGQNVWVKRLKYLEAIAHEGTHTGIRVDRQRGLATSRLDNSLLGNKEFTDEDSGGPTFHVPIHRHGPPVKHKVCWTGDLASHYIEKYNVVPSHDFYFYVIGKSGKIMDQKERGY